MFLQKNFGKHSQLFPKIFSQIFFDFDQKQMILHDFSKPKKKKKFSQKEKYGSVAPVKQGFLFSWS